MGASLAEEVHPCLQPALPLSLLGQQPPPYRRSEPGYMLAAYPQCSTLPPHQLHDHPYRPMLARVRSYTPPGSRRVVADSKCPGTLLILIRS
eukprot:COSAG06_NODE_5950_length_3191_cov_17.779107_2_plen_92_part_00